MTYVDADRIRATNTAIGRDTELYATAAERKIEKIIKERELDGFIPAHVNLAVLEYIISETTPDLLMDGKYEAYKASQLDVGCLNKHLTEIQRTDYTDPEVIKYAQGLVQAREYSRLFEKERGFSDILATTVECPDALSASMMIASLSKIKSSTMRSQIISTAHMIAKGLGVPLLNATAEAIECYSIGELYDPEKEQTYNEITQV